MYNEIKLYALSTCVWCKKTILFLDDRKIVYHVTYVDLLEENEKEKAKEELSKFNPRKSYLTIIVDNSKVIAGYDEDKLKEMFGP